MSEEIIIRQCAPTLAGIKTGSLFPHPYESRKQVTEEIRSFNRWYLKRGLCLLPLRYTDSSVLLLLFRPEQLSEDLKRPLSASILSECGYACKTCGEHIAALIQRFTGQEQFPHEIGLFIGYPPDDVLGFIRNHAENYKMAGLWKVYGDEARACCLFKSYKQCTKNYCGLWEAGATLEQLLSEENTLKVAI